MDTITLLKPPGLVTSPAFSHVAVVPPSATMVYVGGQNSVDENGALVGAATPPRRRAGRWPTWSPPSKPQVPTWGTSSA